MGVSAETWPVAEGIHDKNCSILESVLSSP